LKPDCTWPKGEILGPGWLGFNSPLEKLLDLSTTSDEASGSKDTSSNTNYGFLSRSHRFRLARKNKMTFSLRDLSERLVILPPVLANWPRLSILIVPQLQNEMQAHQSSSLWLSFSITSFATFFLPRPPNSSHVATPPPMPRLTRFSTRSSLSLPLSYPNHSTPVPAESLKLITPLSHIFAHFPLSSLLR
jgi:hypothetical protein